MAITKGKVLKYTLLPGFIPRILTLATSGFGHLAYYIALIYAMVGLLPPDHPYLNGQNVGRYGVRHAIAAASQNLVFKRKNIDQIIIFFTILVGLVLLLVQFILLAISFAAFEPAFASDVTGGEIFRSLFANPNNVTNSQGPGQDIAFIILDRVFGIQIGPAATPSSLFGSCIGTGVPCENTRGDAVTNINTGSFPYPFHSALHLMLRFYSMGILVVGSFVIIYFVITIVGETATTGTPFGKRFNKAWAPIRIIVFFGLLIPINIGGGPGPGLNAAQHITLIVARQGSNLATNAWAYFNTRLSAGSPLSLQEDLISIPNTPAIMSLHQFMLSARTCAWTESAVHGNEIKAYIINPRPITYTPSPSGGATTTPSSGPSAQDFTGTPHDAALNLAQNGNIIIRFGTKGQAAAGVGAVQQYNNQAGNVFPYCGEIILRANDLHEDGSNFISRKYYEILQEMWMDDANIQAGECLYQRWVNGTQHRVDCPQLPDMAFAISQRTKYTQKVREAIEAGVEAQRTTHADNTVPPELLKKGWAGAAIWYNRVAQMNGAVTTAALNIPRASKLPYTLELVLKAKTEQNANISQEDLFSRRLSEGRSIELPDNRNQTHIAVQKAYEYWSSMAEQASPQSSVIQNPIINTINAVLGTSGIFDIRQNNTIHPLAQLTSIGKAMMEAVVRNTGYGVAGIIGETSLSIIGDQFPSQLAGLAKSFMFTVVTSTIGIAVILFYVLPFLPFIYTLFALSGWVKSIFEAIVAMPLWALAHLSIDGDGLSGKGASNGYFLLLEIFLRPVLIVVGLVSTISIFAAMVTVLNSVFDLVVGNVGGYNVEFDSNQSLLTGETNLAFYRGPVDEFMYTGMYAIICYMAGLSTFKLIDLIPNSILRWAGVSVATFQENAGDPASALSSQVYRGSILVGNQIQGATQGNLAAIVSG